MPIESPVTNTGNSFQVNFFLFQTPTLILSIIIWMLINNLHLANDGVEHLRLTLLNNGVFPVSGSRLHSYWLTQWPIQIGLELNLKALQHYINLYALGIFTLYFMPWVIVCYKLKNSPELIPLGMIYSLALGSVALSSSYLLGTEHQALVPLTFIACVLFLSINSNHFGWNIALTGTLYILTRTYETSIIPLFIFLTYCIFLFRQNYKISTYFFILTWMLICAFGIIENFASIIHPREVEHRNGFLHEIKIIAINPVFVTCCISFISIWLWTKFKPASIVTLILSITLQLFIFLDESIYQKISNISFSSRTLTLFIPAILIFEIFYMREYFRNKYFNMVAVIPIALAGFLISIPFIDFNKKIKATTENKIGFIAASDHSLAEHPGSRPWTLPSMSIINQPDCVKSILLNSPNNWEPYSPQDTPGFGKFSQYDALLYPNIKSIHCKIIGD